MRGRKKRKRENLLEIRHSLDFFDKGKKVVAFILYNILLYLFYFTSLHKRGSYKELHSLYKNEHQHCIIMYNTINIDFFIFSCSVVITVLIHYFRFKRNASI